MKNLRTKGLKDRRTKNMIVCFFVFLFFCFFVKCCFAQQQEQWVPVAIQVSTTVSDGSLTLGEVVSAARQKGFRAVVVTDRDHMKWEYGIWPLRNLVKKTIEKGSVFKYGIDKYLKLIELESKKNPDIVIIPGLECAPYYHWSGNILSGDLKISDWHKHILVMGLESLKDLKNLPLLPNKAALQKPYGVRDVVLLWPWLTLLLGAYCMRHRAYRYVDDQGREQGPISKTWFLGGLFIIFFSTVFLANNWPFRTLQYDQYANIPASKPYQILIDYVRRHEGATFWAHPEAENIDRENGIAIETSEHTVNLWGNKDYTGFSIFYEGYEKVGKIGGDWDHLLKAYCEGARESPVWIIAGLAFDRGTAEDLMHWMSNQQVYVLAQALTSDAILDAMKKGRMVVSSGAGKNQLFLEQFVIRDSVSGRVSTLGETLNCEGRPILEIKGRFTKNTLDERPIVEIKVIKDGQNVKVLRPETAMGLDAFYEGAPVDKKSFYRLEITGNGQKIVTNPIFIEKK